MALAQRVVVGTMLGHETGLTIVTQKAGGHWHRAAGVEHVDYRFTVVRRDLHRGVGSAGGGAADEQGQLEALAFHLTGHVDHLVERWSDQAAQSDQVTFSARARSRIFSHDTITPMSITS